MLRNASTVILLLALTIVGGKVASAITNSGTLKGRVVGPDGGVIVGAKVKLFNPTTGRITDAVTDAEGVFTIYNIPHNPYVLTIEFEGFATLSKNLDINTDLPVELGDLKLELATLSAAVTVSAEASGLLETDNASSHSDIDKELIQRFPAASASRGFEQILLSTPGFIADENGRFHFRGSHGQTSTVIDGI